MESHLPPPPIRGSSIEIGPQIPGLRGRDENGGATVSACSVVVVHMRDDGGGGEDTEQPREKETPASLGQPLPLHARIP